MAIALICQDMSPPIARSPRMYRSSCSGLPSCGQRGDYAADNLAAQKHPEVTDSADRYGLHVDVGRHRPEAGHDHVEWGGECEPSHAVRYRRAGESAKLWRNFPQRTTEHTDT